MLFCLDSSASVVSLLYIGFLIWYQFSSIASLSSLFLEFSEGWETVFKFQLEIFLFRCLLHVAWWSLGVFQDLLVCLCVSLAWVSLLQSNSWWSDAASASASASLVALTSCSFLLNRLAMEMWSVWFSVLFSGDPYSQVTGRRFHQWLSCWHIDFTYISHFHSLCQCQLGVTMLK